MNWLRRATVLAVTGGTLWEPARASSSAAWNIPGGGFSGVVAVPGGATHGFKATFEWPFVDQPGQFIQFALDRSGDDVQDACRDVVVYGAQMRY